MEITKEFLLNKINKISYGEKLDSIYKPTVIDFKSIKIRVLVGKIIYFCYIDSKPTTKEFDLTEDEFESIVNKTCKWKKVN